MSSESTNGTSLRLSGELDGEPWVLPLTEGEHVLGSGRECTLVVPARGISRRHAELAVAAGHVDVRDLGSKNGTFVDSRRLEADIATLRPGQIIRFGPLAFTLQEIDRGDALLGVELAASSIADSETDLWVSQASTWWTQAGAEIAERRYFRAFEAVVGRLIDLPEPDVTGALDDLVSCLGGFASAWVEWPKHGGVTVLQGVGELAEIPPIESFGGQDGDLRLVAVDPPRVAAAWRQQDSTLGLILWSQHVVGPGSDELLASLLRLLRRFRPVVDEPSPASAPVGLRMPPGIVRGGSAAMISLYQQMEMLLEGDLPILILGETGVGKEHLARALHRSSPRGDGPFVAINCAAIPETMLEAEVFGIGKGVATGVAARRGRLAEADGGTLLLDEVADMPPELQVKLLRALQEGVIHPLGLPPQAVDVRILASTNAELRQRVADGGFRGDLYYRLAGYELKVPPLRDRHGDVVRLVGHFLRQFCRQAQKPLRGVTVNAMQCLDDYTWPGNVRELEHEMRRLVFCCPRGQAIDSEMLSETIRWPQAEQETVELRDEGLEAQLRQLERKLVVRALQVTAGHRTRAAELLRISRNGLAKKLRRLNLDAADFRP